MRKLLVFTENYARGGGNRYLIDLVNGVAGDFDEIVLAANEGGLFNEDLARLSKAAAQQSVGFVTRARARHRLGRLPPGLLRWFLLPLLFLEPLFFVCNVVRFALYLRKQQPSAVLSCNGGYPGGLACLAMVIAASWCGIPCALSIVSTPLPRRRTSRFYAGFIDCWVWRSVGLIIVNAHAIADSLCQLRGAPRDKIRVVYNGLEMAPVCAARSQPRGALTIGCVSRMDRAKGLSYLYDAFVSLAARYPQIELVVWGEGELRKELNDRAARDGLAQRVKLLGHFQGDVNSVLHNMDIYAFPSLQEGFPYSILEAMRAGRAIVASAVGGVPEAIRHGQDGLLVPSSSSAAIAEAIEQLLTDDEQRERLATSSRARFVREFSLEAMHACLPGLFNGVVH